MMMMMMMMMFPVSLLSTDVLGSVLRGGESLQDAAHLLRKDHRDV